VAEVAPSVADEEPDREGLTSSIVCVEPVVEGTTSSVTVEPLEDGMGASVVGVEQSDNVLEA